ncbi:hypothetical protein TNCV_243561 [Trichonephila clavipes]|uniref:Uncharacterized protein n=1 Tax=Trichonephila clavipes TaxID=2585209 RepID=A0A8X6W4V3_TRICX|nr:hypothetical protein TNCV_243561 [Trichonephila clavipes]
MPLGPLRAEIGEAFFLSALAVLQREPSSASKEFCFVLWVSCKLPKLSGSVSLSKEVFELTLYKWRLRMNHWLRSISVCGENLTSEFSDLGLNLRG